MHKNAPFGTHGHHLEKFLGTGHHHHYLPVVASSYSSEGMRANYKRRRTRTQRTNYPMELEDYDVTKKWQYLMALSQGDGEAQNYDSMFNNPIVRTALDKVHEK